MLEERVGDLFASKDLDAIAHGVNCQGVMGSGIAVLFRDKFPEMYEWYKEECEAGNLILGDVMDYYDVDTDITIYNLATQTLPGANADLDGLEQAVTCMVDHAESEGVRRIGLPQIGAGIGGLNWDDVLDVLHSIAETTTVTLVVHYLP